MLLVLFMAILLIFPLFVNHDDSRQPDRANLAKVNQSYSAHSTIYLNGNAAVDAFCSGNGTDGLTPATAHRIVNFSIDAANVTSCINITNVNRYLVIENCYLSDAYINASSVLYGIQISNCSNLIIDNCSFFDNFYGINVISSYHLDFANISMIQHMRAMFVKNSTDIAISGYCSGIQSYDGVFIHNSTQVRIHDFLMTGVTYGTGFTIWQSHQVSFENITCRGCYTGMSISETPDAHVENCNFSMNRGMGLAVFDSPRCLIRNSTASYNLIAGYSDRCFGIWLENSSESLIKGNSLVNNSEYWSAGGIAVVSSERVTVSENELSGNGGEDGWGKTIYLLESQNCTIARNRLLNNTNMAIVLINSSRCDILSNEISGSERGICFWNSTRNIMRNNTISASYCIYIYRDSPYNDYNDNFINEGCIYDEVRDQNIRIATILAITCSTIYFILIVIGMMVGLVKIAIKHRKAAADLEFAQFSRKIESASTLMKGQRWMEALRAIDLAKLELKCSSLKKPFSSADNAYRKARTLVNDAWESSINERFRAMPQISPSGDIDAIIKNLEHLKNEAVKGNFKAIFTTIQDRIETTKIFAEIIKRFKTSRRVAIPELCTALGIDMQKVLPLILDWSDDLGFIIDGKCMELKDNDFDKFVAQIDKYFAEWKDRERSKATKL